MTLKKIDRETAKEMRARLEAALDALAKEYGVAITVGNCTMNMKSMRYQLDVTMLGEDGKPELKEADTFRLYAASMGMKKEDLGREFTLHGKTYKLRGFLARSQKFPFLCECGGKLFKLPEETVRVALGYPKNPWEDTATAVQVSAPKVA